MIIFIVYILTPLYLIHVCVRTRALINTRSTAKRLVPSNYKMIFFLYNL